MPDPVVACDTVSAAASVAAGVLSTGIALAALGPIAVEQVRGSKKGFRDQARLSRRSQVSLLLLVPTISLAAVCSLVSLFMACASPLVALVLDALAALSLVFLVMSALLFVAILREVLRSDTIVQP